jgi:hypothetical protein
VTLTVYDIADGAKKKVVATADSFQMTGTELRDPDGKVLVYYNYITSAWVVYEDGEEWYDFVIAP